MENDDLYWLIIPLFLLAAVVFSTMGAAAYRKRQKRENREARRQARRAYRDWSSGEGGEHTTR